MLAGKIISVSDLLVEVLLSGVQVKKRDMMYAVKGEKTYRFEVEDIEGNIASLVPFSNVAGLSRGTEVYKAEEGLQMETDRKPGKTHGISGSASARNDRCQRIDALDRDQGA